MTYTSWLKKQQQHNQPEPPMVIQWQISYQQFSSILHTEQTLIDLFEKRSEWAVVLSKIKNPNNDNKLERSPSVTSATSNQLLSS